MFETCKETVIIIRLACPIVLVNIAEVSMNIVNVIMLGQAGKESLAAYALGNMYFNILWYFIEGFLTAQDTLTSQALGSHDHYGISIISELNGIILHELLPRLLYALHHTEDSSNDNDIDNKDDHDDRRGNIHTHNPTESSLEMVSVSVASVTPLHHHHHHHSSEDSSSSSHNNNSITTAGDMEHMHRKRHVVGGADPEGDTAVAMERIDRPRLRPFGTAHGHQTRGTLSALTLPVSSYWTFLALGLPGAVLLGVEMWSFDLITVLAAHLGTTALAAHQTMYTFANLVFVAVSMPLSIALTLRVGSVLGGGQANVAGISTAVALFFGVSLSGLFSLLLWKSKDIFGYIATTDEYVADVVSELALPVTIYLLVDAFQGISQGALRGMGRQGLLAVLTFLAIWVAGVPIGVYLAFFSRPSFGITGLWIGLATSAALLSIVYILLLSNINWDEEKKLARLRAVSLTISSTYAGSCSESLLTHPRPASCGRSAGGFFPIPIDEDEEDDWDEVGSLEEDEEEGTGDGSERR
eukprot:gene6635-13444_t